MATVKAKWNMIKDVTPNNTESSHWILYKDGSVVFKGFRKQCFNMINTGYSAPKSTE